MYDLLQGVQKMHNLGVAHRDLKPKNVYLDTDDTGLRAKIGDFGSCKLLELNYRSDNELPDHKVGTPAYRAPEVFLHYRKFEDPRKADVWAVGCILAEMLLFEPLFFARDQTEYLRKILPFFD